MDDLYQQELLDHYKHPHNFGTLTEPSCAVTETNSSCGDSLTLQLKIKNKIVTEAKFTGSGCAVSMAAASLLTDYIIDRSVKQLKTIDFDFMQQLIGATISPGRVKCLTLSARALMRALNQALGNLDLADDQSSVLEEESGAGGIGARQ